MRKIYFFLVSLLLLATIGCSDDNSKGDNVPGKGPGTIQLAVTGRVGTLVGENLTDYVRSLDLFLFRENNNGIYLLTQTVSFTKAQLEALVTENLDAEAGYTNLRTVDFGDLPIGNYMIAGLGNVRDSVGTPFPNAALTGVEIGNTMDQVIASVAAGNTSPRFFFGLTEPIVLGAAAPANPKLTLFRKVAMFSLNLEKVPSSVRQIEVQVQNTYGAFDMSGAFLNNRVISVNQTNSYNFSGNQPNVPLALITLPSVTGQRSSFTLIFRLDNGQEITIPLPNQYALKANTITKLTATIDSDQSGGVWDIELSISISANVEWNVDQEPGIII